MARNRYRKLAAVLLVAAVIAMLATPRALMAADRSAQLDRLETAIVRAEDVRAIKKLQRAYGYYADRGLWNDLADLFADDATANYPSGGFDGNASIRAMFVQNLGQGREGLAEGRIYNHTILQPVVDLSADGATATGRWRVLGMLGRFSGSATWADSLYRFDYVKQNGLWKIRALTAYAGSGGSYDDGWVVPKPRPAGAADTSPVRFNLAHPADRPWVDPCEADVSVCVVPFPYPNRGSLRAPAKPTAQIARGASAADAGDRAVDLLHRAQRLEDEALVMNLQNAYGYYLDRGQWQQLAGLFAPDGTREVGLGGVYVGRDRVRQSMELSGPAGLREGQINDHLQFEPIITVAPDGLAAQGRIFELGLIGGGGAPGRLIQNVQENTYVKREGRWMIESAHHYTILLTDSTQGWARSAFPPRAISTTLPPDRPPSVVYEAYPKVFTPPLRFGNPSKIAATPSATPRADAVRVDAPRIGDTRVVEATASALSTAQRQALRAADYDEIENLQNAWGYYAEKSLWSDMAALLTARGSLAIDEQRHDGRKSALAFLEASGPTGPVKGALNSQLHLQPVIHIAADGRSAKIRSRLLQLSRDAAGRPQWGGGIYENEAVKEGGVWKFSRVHLYRTLLVDYRAGWAQAAAGEGQRLPSRFTPPFHYRESKAGGLVP